MGRTSSQEIGKRLRQGLGSLSRRRPDPVQLRQGLDGLTPAQANAFRELPGFDQAHLLRTHDWLIRQGVTNHDQLMAGLFHDIGKYDNGVSVSTFDRAVRVLLRTVSPGLLERLAAPGGAGYLRGISLSVHHPEIGGRKARALGCSERTCWLIANHERHGVSDDPELAMLQRADSAS